MKYLDTAAQNQFIKYDSQMLQQLFGTDDIEPFWVADMDFQVADAITEEFQRLIDRGVYAYEFASGDIFNSIVDWNKNRHNLALDNKAFIQVPGVLTGIALLIREITQPEDGILIQSPVYHQFAHLIKTANRKVVDSPLRIIDGRYEMDFNDLEEKLAVGNVKIILLCNPHNPVGRVWRPVELERLVVIAQKYNVKIVSDEIHSDIIYGDYKFTSIASMGNTDNIAVLGSPAKTFGMQSVANGYLYIIDEELSSQIKGITESMYLSHGNAFTTFGTIAAFKHGGAWLDGFLADMQKTVSWISNYTGDKMDGVNMFPVEGTYQIWLDFRKAGLPDDELKKRVFEQAKVGLTPGSWFGGANSQFMRMNIASPLPKVRGAFERLATALR